MYTNGFCTSIWCSAIQRKFKLLQGFRKKKKKNHIYRANLNHSICINVDDQWCCLSARDSGRNGSHERAWVLARARVTFFSSGDRAPRWAFDTRPHTFLALCWRGADYAQPSHLRLLSCLFLFCCFVLAEKDATPEFVSRIRNGLLFLECFGYIFVFWDWDAFRLYRREIERCWGLLWGNTLDKRSLNGKLDRLQVLPLLFLFFKQNYFEIDLCVENKSLRYTYLFLIGFLFVRDLLVIHNSMSHLI